VYTGNEAHALSEQRRLETKPSPKLDDRALTREIMGLFKQDLSVGQISGRLGILYPGRKGKQVSPSTIYWYVYQETAKRPSLKVHFRQQQAKPHHRKGTQDRRGQIFDRVSIDERPNIVEQKSRAGDWEGDTVESAEKNAYIAKFVDRKTKVLLADPNVSINKIVDIDYVIKNSYSESLKNEPKFDYVIATHVIEHILQLILFFQDISKILNPNGKLCLSIPDKRFRLFSLSDIICRKL
jgi:IS30 family transposase